MAQPDRGPPEKKKYEKREGKKDKKEKERKVNKDIKKGRESEWRRAKCRHIVPKFV